MSSIRKQQGSKFLIGIMIKLLIAGCNVAFANAGEMTCLNVLELNKKDTLNTPAYSGIGVRYNDLTTRENQLALKYLVEQVYGDERLRWSVSSLSTSFHTQYLRIGFEADQCILSCLREAQKPITTSSRFGMSLLQTYTDNTSVFFKVKGATGNLFPEVVFSIGFDQDIGILGRGGVEIYAISFGYQQNYGSTAISFSKSFKRHSITIKPYYSKTTPGHINLILIDELGMRNAANLVIFKLVTGYYPDTNSYISFERINDSRCRLTCEGSLKVLRLKTTLLPAISYEYAKAGSGNYYRNWYAQLGIRVSL